MDSLEPVLSLDDLLGDELTMDSHNEFALPGMDSFNATAMGSGFPLDMMPLGDEYREDAVMTADAVPASAAAPKAEPEAASGSAPARAAPARRRRARKPRARAGKLTAKEEERKRRNRESAALSRKRKRAYTESLEGKVAELTEQNRKLARVTEELAASNERLRLQLEQMEAALGIGGPEDEAELAAEIEAELKRAGMSPGDARALAAGAGAGAGAGPADTSMLSTGVAPAATTGVTAPVAAAPVC